MSQSHIFPKESTDCPDRPDPRVRAGILDFLAEFSKLKMTAGDSEGIAAFEGNLLRLTLALGNKCFAYSIDRLVEEPARLSRDGGTYRRAAATPKKVMSLFGEVTVSRSRYRRRGASSIVPLDEALCLANDYFTPLAAGKALRVLAETTPREGAQLLPELSGLCPSVSSLQRLAYAASEQIESGEGEVEARTRLEEAIPAAARHVEISLDGVMVPMIKAENGVKSTRYKEAACAALSLIDAAGTRLQTRYRGRMPEPGKAALKRWIEEEVAVLRRRRPDLKFVMVADGAVDNWKFLSNLVDGAPEILDFWHAAGHLRKVADAVFDTDAGKADKWFVKHRQCLRHEPNGVEIVIRALRYLRRTAKRGVDEVERELAYFCKNRSRMRYAAWAEAKLPIGSGVVEAANKTLVTQRMKRSGQRWSRSGGQAILTIRAWVKSGRFEMTWGHLAKQWLEPANDCAPVAKAA